MTITNENEYILQEYRKGRSMGNIGKDVHLSANGVKKRLIKMGEKIRNKSEAQKLSLELGYSTHPTLGKERDLATRQKLSKKMREYATQEEVAEEKSRKNKEFYKNLSPNEREIWTSKKSVGLRKAKDKGSELENFIKEGLKEAGFLVQSHRKGLIPSDKLEVDMFVPALNLVVEIDGPSHFKPVFGEERLRSQQQSDKKKYGLLANYGFKILRVKQLGSISEVVKKELLDKVLVVVKNPITQSLTEVE